MANGWCLFLCVPILVQLRYCSAMLSEGVELPCSNEGERISDGSMKFITDVDPCIQCFCRNGIVKCEIATCPDLEGCHMILYRSTSSQSCCDVCVGCTEDGIRYKSGQVWRSNDDPCVVKECKAGVITTSTATCPKLACDNPVEVKGQCCLSCPTCELNDEKYSEGESFEPHTDKCVRCECKNGGINCMKNACPVLNCPAAKIVQEEGECCPRCTGTRTTFLVPRMCLFKHNIYNDGRTYEVNDCTHCTCQGGTMSCTRRTCPILDCPVEEQVFTSSESCCPVCKPDSMYEQCEYEENTHEHGASWQDGCVDCVCYDGTVTCSEKECDTQQHCPLDTHQLKFTTDACCPVCVEKEGLCTVFGDPHYVTFDKRIYDFQGTCKYMLAKDCPGNMFAIYVQNFDRYNMPGAWTKSVTILLNADTKIGLRKNGKVRINKSQVSLPFSKVGHFTVRYEEETIVVDTEIGLKVVWNTESYLELHLPASLKRNTCGMCGNFNGDPKDDFMGKDGTLFTSAIDFAKSWQHGRQSTCQVGVTQQEVQARCQDNFSKWQRAHQECSILKSRALKECRKTIDVEAYYKSCVTDSCNCPRHRKCTCDAVTAYVRECERVGIYDIEAPLNYSCSRQRRRIQERVTKNLQLQQEASKS
ncbi:BMP-binding endothelial regulator protein-like [Watersipora subatra]|uniref:BMP-binding endothelial regulator protein-like n=1 Tax=Watersipora subatra TaxID=2589382 RepID=UPI00355C469B